MGLDWTVMGCSGLASGGAALGVLLGRAGLSSTVLGVLWAALYGHAMPFGCSGVLCAAQGSTGELLWTALDNSGTEMRCDATTRKRCVDVYFRCIPAASFSSDSIEIVIKSKSGK